MLKTDNPESGKNYIKKKRGFLEERLGFYFSRLVSRPLIPPEHVYFSLTNRCTLRCRMCDIFKEWSKVEDELSTREVKDIILQIKEMGIRHLIFSGGEPLIRKDIFEILEFAAASEIDMIDIITNGTLLDDNAIQRLIGLRINHITISLDGLGDTNDKIRGKGVFEKAARHIDRLNHYKSKRSVSLPTLGINFTIMNENIDDILPMVEFARSKKSNIIVFQPVLFSNIKMHEKKSDILWPSEENIPKVDGIVKEIIQLKKTLNDIMICTETDVLKAIPDYFRGKRPKGNFKCYEGVKRIVISCNGRLWSCVKPYGDLKKDRLRDIWFSREADGIRDEVKMCKKHCLQDCVYFPSDIIREISAFLKELKSADMAEEDKTHIRENLLGKVRYYTSILSEDGRPALSNFLRRLIGKLS